ncbi:MAG: phosphatidylglycerol lysyltransferase domain-containing protein [Candidatus Paceibacterota bacterium]
MIPEFPKFKNLELTDKKDIEKFTSKFPPYSDFNFISMWSWDIKGEMRLSQLNNNLVVRFTDYITGKPFYSFLGKNKVNETANALLNLSKEEEISQYLQLIPEEIVSKLNKNKFKSTEERGHFDYLVSVDRLMPHKGETRKLSSRRKLINKFKETKEFEIKLMDIGKKEIQNKIRSVFTEWEMEVENDKNATEHLHLALEKFFLAEKKFDNSILTYGAFIKNKLVGYSVSEKLGADHAVGHFQQADLKIFSGIYALLMHETAPFFKSEGVTCINLEQDLSIPGLRKWKSSHNPIGFLKKYKVSAL